jgi:hypothetical protein
MSIPKKGKNGFIDFPKLNAITVGVPLYVYEKKKKAQRSTTIVHRELCRLPSC